MIHTNKKWNREDDLELISLIYKGMTQDGIQGETGLTAPQQGNRLKKLGLSISGGRKAKREGMTAENYLETSPIYKPLEANRDSIFPHGSPPDDPFALSGYMLGRAATDNWGFGILLTSGDVLGVACIDRISPDGLWLDVEMLDSERAVAQGKFDKPIIGAPTVRAEASILISNICAIIELWYT